ncbi:HAMP domain-containing sensor histidine kinase [Rhodanobacter sp. 7MK24]|uniref:sensor histidine kinase n=1 Tax=Rhodanobacter sp. 7MK24 TaxID=2775922 RepID=UPI001CE08942|nr:HAMP domain-containing sensor histidine kinase [Rhodanobacter sp. 7MK24]
MRPLIDVWRAATSRLILIYGALFVVWSVVLLGAIQWESSRYLTHVLDQIVSQRMQYLVQMDMEHLPQAVDAAGTLDPHGIMSAGLFDARGRPLAGNMASLPQGLVADGKLHPLPKGVVRIDRLRSDISARAMAQRLAHGELLVLAKDTSTIDGLGAIIRRTLLWGLSLTVIPGLLGGLLLSRGPVRRIREIQLATEPIQRGDLTKRLPVSRRGDELDVLAGIVNTMLGEIERLMGEVKGVCDNIAHDLRTPLTRLRARLYRAQQQLDGRSEAVLVEACVADIDAVLTRFRALLRVSELEDRHRSACFSEVDLERVLHQVHDFYAPLAEDRDLRFLLELAPLVPLRGDAHLLFEAFANLVGNAIKFTPAGGRVLLRARMERSGPRVDVLDGGPGIPAGERDAVTRRFYRGDNSRSTPGSGLGLSIVSAIVRLHGYVLEIGDGEDGGACISMHCLTEATVEAA